MERLLTVLLLLCLVFSAINKSEAWRRRRRRSGTLHTRNLHTRHALNGKRIRPENDHDDHSHYDPDKKVGKTSSSLDLDEDFRT